MKKIELVALLTDSKNIIELLQRKGLVEPRRVTNNALTNPDTRIFVSRFEKSRDLAKQALAVLNEKTQHKTPITAFVLGKREYSKNEFEKKSELFESTLKVCHDILESEKTITDCKNEISQLEVKNSELESWKGLDIPPNFSTTAQTSCFIGTIFNKNNLEIVLKKLKTSTHIEIISSVKETTNLVVICLKSDREKTNNILRQAGFSPIGETKSKNIKESIYENNDRIKKLSSKISEHEKAIFDLSFERENIEFLIDFLDLKCDKYKAVSDLGMTQSVFVLTGYIPEKYSKDVSNEIENRYNAVITLTDPNDEDDVPVMLENSKFSSPLESITEMYALPNSRDIDPTSVMSFFYYLLFGIMLSDAGYGVVMFAVTTVALKKLNLDAKMKKTMEMFRYSGISTIFWGSLFGSWFGDLPQTVANQFFSKNVGSLALWFEPLTDPIKLLVFSFALGIAHLFWGLAVKFSILWKDGKKLDAVFDVFPIYMTVLGVAPIACGILISVPTQLKTAGKYLAIVGAVLIILTSGRNSENILARFLFGFYGLYNTATGYLSDILSYSRLLALGLATGSIASVINLIGTMPKNIFLKAIVFFVVFAFGHTANLAINLLGAYVHTDRLQFVELFSKFYEGGGKRFEPLRMNTKYINLVEEKNE